MRAWARVAGRLLYGRCGDAYLIDAKGNTQPFQPEMPGDLPPFAGMSQYSLSADARVVAYSLHARDQAGTSYRDLVVQQMTGSKPIRVATGNASYRGVLSPDGTYLAYAVDASIKVTSVDGNLVAGIAAPETVGKGVIQEIRWAPDGKRIAARLNHKLYIAAVGDSQLTLLIQDEKIHDVANFDWSPTGEEIAFRSAFEGEQSCSYGPQMSGGKVVFRVCAPGFRLYAVSTVDRVVRRLNASTEFRPMELFWLQ